MPDPQVPTIATPAQSATVPATPSPIQSGGDVSDLMKTMGVGLVAPTAPQHSSASVPTSPHVTPPQMRPMQDDNRQPMRNNRHSEQIAERHNKFASISNVLNSYSNKKNAEKYNVLTKNIQDVINAQTQISNAETALKNNPNDPAAKEVLEKNKKFIEGKLSDDKVRKDMAKAFDISFVDPAKNNTPEVKAGQAAIAAAKAQETAGINHNTPQEKAVAESLNKEQPKPETQQPQQSATPYADQFMKSRPAALQENPEYARQMAASVKREEAIVQHVIPKILDAQMRTEVAAMQQQGAAERTEYTQLSEDIRAQARLAAQQGIANDRNKTYLQGVASRNAAALTRTNALIASREKLAKDPQFHQNAARLEALNGQILTSIDRDITQITNQNSSLEGQKALYKDGSGKVLNPTAIATIDQNIKMNNAALKVMQEHREQVQTSRFGTEEAPLLKGMPSATRTASGPADDSDNSDDEDSLIDRGDFTGEGVDVNEQ